VVTATEENFRREEGTRNIWKNKRKKGGRSGGGEKRTVQRQLTLIQDERDKNPGRKKPSRICNEWRSTILVGGEV